jgi:ATP-dependent DNA ligase
MYLADLFPLAAAAVAALPVRSCIADGEAIVCDDWLAMFDFDPWSRAQRPRHALCVRLDRGERRRPGPRPIEERKRRLAGLLRRPDDGIAFNEHCGVTAPEHILFARCALKDAPLPSA